MLTLKLTLKLTFAAVVALTTVLFSGAAIVAGQPALVAAFAAAGTWVTCHILDSDEDEAAA